MYIPSNRIVNDRIVFSTDVMELIDVFQFNGDVFDYRFMYEYNERESNRMVTSYSKRLFDDKRWHDMIREMNVRFVDMHSRIAVINSNDHIVINDRIATLFGEDELEIGYDGALYEVISFIRDTDLETFGGDINDAQSAVNAINRFVRVVRAMND